MLAVTCEPVRDLIRSTKRPGGRTRTGEWGGAELRRASCPLVAAGGVPPRTPPDPAPARHPPWGEYPPDPLRRGPPALPGAAYAVQQDRLRRNLKGGRKRCLT